MPLLGRGALLLSFDVVPEALDEHDDWHTHEHLPERLAIPGFLRGTRWTARRGAPRYCVLYEVEHLDVLVSDAYRQRLDNPTPWTSKLMPHYRGMARGLCSVVSSHGLGTGRFGLLVRFDAAPGRAAELSGWLASSVLPALPLRPGLGSVHLLEAGVAAPMTNEQRIRGVDAGVGWALLATGYRLEALDALDVADLAPAPLEAHGATGVASALYEADHTLTAQECDALAPRRR